MTLRNLYYNSQSTVGIRELMKRSSTAYQMKRFIVPLIFLAGLRPVWSQQGMRDASYQDTTFGLVQRLESTEMSQAAQNTAPDQPRLQFPGEILPKPQLIAEVVAPMWGKVYLEEGVYPGTKVVKGQNLARIVLELPSVERLPLDDRTLDIEQVLEVALQKLGVTSRDYERALSISETYPDFKEEMNRRKRIYENALEEFQNANRQRTAQMAVLQRRDPRIIPVTSPLTGYINEIHFVQGDVNRTDEFRKLFTIVALSTVWVQVEVYEKDLEIFRNAQECIVIAEAYPGEKFKGRFQALGSEMDPHTRSIPVYYEIPNPEEKLKVGLRVRVVPLRDPH